MRAKWKSKGKIDTCGSRRKAEIIGIASNEGDSNTSGTVVKEEVEQLVVNFLGMSPADSLMFDEPTLES